MLEYKVKINGSVFIRWQGASIDTSLYPQTKIYNVTAPTVAVATLNLAHINKGLYGYSWTPTTVGQYFTQTIIYSTDYGVDESGIDRPDSDSIYVEESTGGSSYLIGARQADTKADDFKLSDDDINKIANKVLSLIKPELPVMDQVIKLLRFIYNKDNKIDLSPISRSLYDIKKNVSVILSKEIVFDNSDIIKRISDAENSILSASSNDDVIDKINMLIGTLSRNREESEVASDDDIESSMIAQDILKNPGKVKDYFASKKLTNDVVNKMLWLKGIS